MSNCSFAQNRHNSNTSFSSSASLISQRRTDLPLRVDCQKFVKEISCESGIFVEWGGVKDDSFQALMRSLRLSWRTTWTRTWTSEEETRSTRHGPGSSLFDNHRLAFFSVNAIEHLSEWLLSQEPWNPAWKRKRIFRTLVFVYFIWITILPRLEIDVTPVRVVVSLDLV